MRPGLFVVTGASSGIGQAIAWELADQDHKVIACGRDENKMAETLKKNAGILPFLADLTKPAAAEKLLKLVEKQETPLLGLVNNAGVYETGPFATTSEEVWENQFQVNLLSAVRITRNLYPFLKAAAPSSVLNISSTLGLRTIAGTAAYSAMKAAMINWTQTLALEWATQGIRANCICPGLVDTPIHGFYGKEETHKARQSAHAAQPIGRMGRPVEIAWAAHFLMGEKSNWTTGAVLTVDGGIVL